MAAERGQFALPGVERNDNKRMRWVSERDSDSAADAILCRMIEKRGNSGIAVVRVSIP